MGKDSDFSAEDDQEAVETFEVAANSEYQRLLKRLKEEKPLVPDQPK